MSYVLKELPKERVKEEAKRATTYWELSKHNFEKIREKGGSIIVGTDTLSFRVGSIIIDKTIAIDKPRESFDSSVVLPDSSANQWADDVVERVFNDKEIKETNELGQ
jgi:hypothetical protein